MLLLFTDIQPDVLIHYKIGWIIMALTCMNLLVNTTFLAIDTFFNLKRHLSKYFSKNKIAKIEDLKLTKKLQYNNYMKENK